MLNRSFSPLVALAVFLATSSVVPAHGADPDGPDYKTVNAIKRELEVTDESLAACRFQSGLPIPMDNCKRWQTALAKAYAEADRAAEQRSQLRQANDEFEAERRRKAEEQAKENARRAAERAEEEKATAARIAAEDAKYKAEAAKADREEAQMRSRCGNDYMRPRVGMTLSRAQQCLGSYDEVGQINRRDGVVTTFSNGSTTLHVMRGKVIAWYDR